MLIITNGVDVFNVTKGAFDTIYKNMGFHIFDDNVDSNVVNNVDDNDSNAEDVTSSDTSDDSMENVKDKSNYEEEFIENVMKKPISSWSKVELKKYASINGIDISSAKSVSDVRELIKNSWV